VGNPLLNETLWVDWMRECTQTENSTEDLPPETGLPPDEARTLPVLTRGRSRQGSSASVHDRHPSRTGSFPVRVPTV
jgi:hypothetical protein